ncbi:glycosyl transferase [Cytophagales bacterium WSM2-2]|nr:glycosyl transferase [Cytophagales bacterium WSM2-2]
MDISVIIINYNTFDLTCRCIESVLEKTKDVTFEIILVDNNSTETDPEKFINRFGASIKLIRSNANGGFAKGNNLGIEKATGDFILLLNSDTFLKNNVLLMLKSFLVSYSHIAAVSGRLEFPDGTIQSNCQRFPSIKAKLFELLRLQKLFPKAGSKILLGYFFDHNSVAFPDWIWGTCFMFRKNLLEKLPRKKLADDFFMYVEDMQWCLEFRSIGYGVAFEPGAQLIHYLGKSGGARNDLAKKNHAVLMRLYYHPVHAALIKFLDRLLIGL